MLYVRQPTEDERVELKRMTRQEVGRVGQRALLRRVDEQAGPGGGVLTVSEVSLDPVTREARVWGAPVRLTAAECRLLEALLRQPGTALAHRFLLERIWGAKYLGDVQSLKVFVRRLRQKLGDDPEQPRYIQSEWGIGYGFIGPR